MKEIFINSQNHLRESQKTYTEHFKGAFYYGYKMLIGALASFMHGLFPFLFDGLTAKTVIDIYYDELHNHKNEKYQDYIKTKTLKND